MKNLMLVLALWASPAAAQTTTHPCDVVPTAVTISGAAPLSLLFCAKPSELLTRIDVATDGDPATTYLEGEAVSQGGPNAEGYVQFKVPLVALPAGPHTVTVRVLNLNEEGAEQASDLSDPYAFTVTAPIARPSKPKITGVTK